MLNDQEDGQYADPGTGTYWRQTTSTRKAGAHSALSSLEIKQLSQDISKGVERKPQGWFSSWDFQKAHGMPMSHYTLRLPSEDRRKAVKAKQAKLFEPLSKAS